MTCFRQDGLTVTSTFQMVAERRRQAVLDFPVLRRCARVLRTASGRHMERWDTLALAIELLMLGHTSAQVARSPNKCRKTIRRLRERLIAGGFLNGLCPCGKPLNHSGIFCSFRRKAADSGVMP